MTKCVKDNFDDLIKYRLYRDVDELLHPSISKSNISNYKIILKDELLPIRVFYPTRVSKIDGVIIYIPGNGEVTDSMGKYSMISRELSIKCKKCLIAIDYFDKDLAFPDVYDNVYELVKYIYVELEKSGLPKDKITLMGDSFGATLVNYINMKMIDDKIDSIGKSIVLYPMISMKYDDESLYESFEENGKIDLLTLNKCNSFIKLFGEDKFIKILDYDKLDKFPKCLVITGDVDPLRDEGHEFYTKLKNSKYYNLEGNTHGFLQNIKTMKNNVYDEINEFIKE